MSCRAGMERNARVSSMKPERRPNPAISVTDCWNYRIAAGLSRNHHGAPAYTEG